MKEIDNPAFLPEPTYIETIEEPMVKAFVICPNEYIGDMMALISEKRGTVDHTETLDSRRVMLTSLLPLNEILIDFHDRIKSITRGYGSMDYEHAGYRESDMVKLDMLVNGESVDAFSCIVHRDKAEGRGRALAAKLKEVIPRQQYAVAIQAAIGGKVIARETVSALRKDVTAKCYGGDITPQAQAAGEAEGRQETHEILRLGQHPAGSVHRGVEGVKPPMARTGTVRTQAVHPLSTDATTGFSPGPCARPPPCASTSRSCSTTSATSFHRRLSRPSRLPSTSCQQGDR